MFELKLTFKSADDLYAAVAKLAGETVPAAIGHLHSTDEKQEAPAPVVVTAEVASGEKKKPGRPRKAAEPEVTSAATGASEQDPAPVVKEEPKPEGDAHLQTDAFPAPAPNVIPTHDDVTQAAQAVNAKVGLAKLKTLLAEFQAARVSEVKVEDRAGFIARAQELCA